ncbi:cell surface protein [Listeria monocytogenes]|nr:cell surface protein [Listeria monocytogenes]
MAKKCLFLAFLMAEQYLPIIKPFLLLTYQLEIRLLLIKQHSQLPPLKEYHLVILLKYRNQLMYLHNPIQQ